METTSATVRIHHHLLACLVIISSSCACARGGPSGALAAASEGILMLAIIAGLIAGVLCGSSLRRTPWKSLIVLSVVAIAVAFVFPLFRNLLMMPLAVVSLPIFISISYLVRNLFQSQHLVGLSQASTNGKPRNSRAASASNILRWVAGTYVFWTIASLANFELFSFLAFPLTVFIYPKMIENSCHLSFHR
jgi:hypothetical protein